VPVEKWDEGPAAANAWIAAQLAELGRADVSDSVTFGDTVEAEIRRHKWDFFISYNTADEAFAKFVDDILRQAGYTAFIQFRDMPAGSDFLVEMNNGLANSSRLIAILTPRYVASTYCQAEWNAAYRLDPLGESRKIIPLLFEDCDLQPLSGSRLAVKLAGMTRKQQERAILEAVGRLPKLKPPKVPKKKPAAIEPVTREGRLTLPRKPAVSALDADSLATSLAATRGLIEELAADLSADRNFDKRLVGEIRRIAAKIPEGAPQQNELFILAHEQELMLGWSEIIDAECPKYLAIRYQKVTLRFGKTLRQFARLADYERETAQQRIRPEDRAGSAQAVSDFAQALSEGETKEFVDPEIPRTLGSLVDDKNDDPNAGPPPAAGGADTRIEDAVASSENILSELADVALDLGEKAQEVGAAYAEEFGEGAVEQAKKDGKKDGANLVKWARRVLIAAGAGASVKVTGLSGAIAQILDQFPNIAEWLQPVIEHLSR